MPHSLNHLYQLLIHYTLRFFQDVYQGLSKYIRTISKSLYEGPPALILGHLKVDIAPEQTFRHLPNSPAPSPIVFPFCDHPCLILALKCGEIVTTVLAGITEH